MPSDEEELELDSPPIYELGDKVKITSLIKNDGTYPGKKLGEVLLDVGEEGYVVEIGDYLQRAYVYAIRFMGQRYCHRLSKRRIRTYRKRGST